MISKVVEKLAAQWRSENPAEILLVAAGSTTCLAPGIGLVPNTLGRLLAVYDCDPRLAAYISLGLWGAAAPVMFAKLIKEHRQINRLFFASERRRGLMLGKMWVPENVCLTHIKVTGMTGAGKSAAVFIPAIKKLLTTYCDEDNDRRSKNPFKKIGMAVLEVKGTFFEYIVYLVHEAGRNSSADVILFRPDSRLPLAHFVDKWDKAGRPTKDARHWYLNAMPHTWAANETSSDAHQLYAHLNREGRPNEIYPPTVFRESKNREEQATLAELSKLEVEVTPDTRFAGWRRDGEDLVRVSHTPIRDCPEKLLMDGREIRVEVPKSLRFVDILYISNGLKTNIIKPNLPVSEVASRLAILTKMAKGTEENGKQGNEFFYTAAEKQMQNCIALHRAVHHADGVECTPIDLVRLTTDSDLVPRQGENKTSELSLYLTAVDARAKVLKAEIAQIPDMHTRQLRMDRELSPLIDLKGYFNNEWSKHQLGDGKIAASINAVITNAFKWFMSDANLRETYCAPQTIDYRSIFNDGKIICFVPGKEYETIAKMLAVDFKMDVVSTALARKNLGLEMHRLAVFVQDEGQEYIISHNTVGDNKALAQLREFRFWYLMGTQSDAWVDVAIGRTAGKVYLQGYGTNVYLRNNDEATNQRAAMLCGKIKVEDRSVKQNMSLGGLVFGDDVSTSQTLGYKEKNFIEPHEFNHFPTGAGVVVRTGEDGQQEQVKMVKFDFDFTTSDEGHAAVGNRLRWYFCEVVENTLHKAGQSDRIHHIRPKGDAAPSPAPPLEAPPARVSGEPDNDLTVDSLPEKPLSPENPLPKAPQEANITLPDALPAPLPTPAPQQPPVAPEKTPVPDAQPPRVPEFKENKPPVEDLTGEEILEGVANYEKHLIRLGAHLDAIGYQPMINYAQYQAEEAEKVAAAKLPEYELSNRMAHGPGSRSLGNKDIASRAAPRSESGPPGDLKDLGVDEDTAARERAIREAREDQNARGPELRPGQGIPQERLFDAAREPPVPSF